MFRFIPFEKHCQILKYSVSLTNTDKLRTLHRPKFRLKISEGQRLKYIVNMQLAPRSQQSFLREYHLGSYKLFD